MAETNEPLTIRAAQQIGAPLPTVQTAEDDQPGMLDARASFVDLAAGWCMDSDGDYDDD